MWPFPYVKTRLARNLQRLFRAKNSTFVPVYVQRMRLHVSQTALAAQSNARGSAPDEGSLLVQQMRRDHAHNLQRDHEELQRHATHIQRWIRGRVARRHLRGIQRLRAPFQPSRNIRFSSSAANNNNNNDNPVVRLTRREWSSRDERVLAYAFAQPTVVYDEAVGLLEARRIALSSNPRVTSLGIAAGTMEGEGLMAIANSLRANKGLQVLAIGRNGIGIDTPWCGALSLLAHVLCGVNFHLSFP